MSSPMARHWKKDGPVKAVRVHDRGKADERRQRCRADWLSHGAELVSSFEGLVGEGDLDGVFICCGKNGDDLSVISTIAKLLSASSRDNIFICHMSTVSTEFARAAEVFCRGQGVAYVNYPLTGGPIGAELGKLLILASGPRSLFERLKPALNCLGTPKYFGEDIAAGAEVKLIGHLMVFNGLVGICSAAALHAECFNRGLIGGKEQAEFFDFLNAGAGGTRQWDVILSAGIKEDRWDAPFFISYAVVDALYALELCIQKGVSLLVTESLINVILSFSYVFNNIDPSLATHSIVREMVKSRSSELDRFLMENWGPRGDIRTSLKKCLASLPEKLRAQVKLDVAASDFKA